MYDQFQRYPARKSQFRGRKATWRRKCTGFLLETHILAPDEYRRQRFGAKGQPRLGVDLW